MTLARNLKIDAFINKALLTLRWVLLLTVFSLLLWEGKERGRSSASLLSVRHRTRIHAEIQLSDLLNVYVFIDLFIFLPFFSLRFEKKSPYALTVFWNNLLYILPHVQAAGDAKRTPKQKVAMAQQKQRRERGGSCVDWRWSWATSEYYTGKQKQPPSWRHLTPLSPNVIEE